jgi:putative SOS response-associated peptidase YedK
MCGRYQLTDPKQQYDLEFSIKGPVPNWKPRINFSPTNSGPFVTAERQMRVGHWGLIAAWSKVGKMERPTFNARAETVREKPTFRSAFKARRCIVPADAFYEWSGPKSDRIPHEIMRIDGKPLALAGLWDA